MSVPETETCVAVAAVDSGGGTAGPGQSLSCSHSAHSGSRDLLRDIRKSLGEAEVGCGSWAKTLTAEMPGKYYYFALFCRSFYCFIFIYLIKKF